MQLHPSDETFDLPAPIGADGSPRGVRLRVGVGAGVILVLVAAGIAVVISAVGSHPASAESTGEKSSYTSSVSTSSESSSGDSSSGDSSSSVPAAADEAGAGGTGATGPATALVQVVGQVQKPGLYELPSGDRVVDAVAAAGGFTAKADQASLNLAQVIADGQQIVVLQKGVAPAANLATNGSTIVDINTADATALETLDGIGPAMAQRILAYRTTHGGFRSVNDLQNVSGIGPAKFAAIKGSVSI